jgi:hypothetical protein
MLENRVLRKIFEPKRKELTRDWRKLHSGGLHELYCWPNIIQMIKSRRMTYEGQKYLMEKDHFEDLSVDGGIILKWISKK